MTSASGKSYCTKCLLKKLYAWAELHYTGRFLSTESRCSFRAEKPRVKCLWPKPETPIFNPNIHYPASCVPILLLSRWPLTGPQADVPRWEKEFIQPQPNPKICMDLPADGVRYVSSAQILPSLPDLFIDISILSLSFPLRQIQESMWALKNGHGKQLLWSSVKRLQGKTALWLHRCPETESFHKCMLYHHYIYILLYLQK